MCFKRTVVAAVAWAVVLVARPARAQDAVDRYLGRPVATVQLELENRRDASPALMTLLDTRPGAALTVEDLRSSIARLWSAGQFDQISVTAHETPDGVALVYHLTSRHEVDQVEFTGDTGAAPDALRRGLIDRFNGLPPRSRLEAARAAVEVLLRDDGFERAVVTADVRPRPDADGATMHFAVTAGAQAAIGTVTVTGASPFDRDEVVTRTDTAPGRPYRPAAISAALDGLVDRLRTRGYYEATASPVAEISADGTRVDLTLDVEAGPIVDVRFAGDPLPAGDPDDLVPIRREHSADEDLLEDSARHIASLLQQAGYRHARVAFTAEDHADHRVITFTVTRGPRVRVAGLQVTGNTAVSTAAVEALLGVPPQTPVDDARLAAGVEAVRASYLARGFAGVVVTPSVQERPAPAGAAEVAADITVAIVEGPRTTIDAVVMTGNTHVSEATLAGAIRSTAGTPYVEAVVAADRQALEYQYLDRGFESVRVAPAVTFSADRATARVTFAIAEGPQTIVDRIIVVGNRRTSTQTILGRMALHQGQPLGAGDRERSLQNLQQLGLFRRIRIDEAPRPAGAVRTDVIVTVEESPATTLAYGGGVQAARRFRGATEHLDVAPRGSFEIGRRNLWGKNRSLDLFTSTSVHFGAATVNEYNVTGTYTEPRVFGWNADAHASLTYQQAVRTLFNYRQGGAVADLTTSLDRHLRLSGRYSLESTRLFDIETPPASQLLIDRVFPRVRLSIFAVSLVRDTRDDPVEPGRGMLTSVDGSVAARAVGSQVGFVKTFLQTAVYHRVGDSSRVVLAGDVRVGLARGFPRQVDVLDANGQVIDGADGQPLTQTVNDVPASERFFAGGATTVRGFPTDRLGVPAILTPDGSSNGGNALLIFNGEVRTTVWRNFGAVGFLDAGNVFPKPTAISLAALRTSLGVGLRYKSPFGPLRLDFGFKLGALLPTDQRRMEFAFSIGEAF